MNRRQYREEMNRRHLQRMADADTIEVVPMKDEPYWEVRCYYTGRGRTEYIGGASCMTFERAVAEAHLYATQPGSLTGNKAVS